CSPPERLQDAEPEGLSPGQGFPVGSTVSYVCRPGYMKIFGKPATRTCGEDLQWSPTERFCTERKCNHPGELEHGFITVGDLTFGSKATFSCQRGFRLIGTSEISCVVKNKGVDWDKDLPFCERIPCGPPPDIPHGHYTAAANYVYETAVTYTCDQVPKGSDPFSLIGSATIFCTSDENLNGIWSEPLPQCKVVKCDNPKVENGKKVSGFGSSYSYRDSVRFQCDPGFFLIGSDIITCGEDNTWSPPKPTCERISEDGCGAPKITAGTVIPAESVYRRGESVQIKCIAGCTFPDGTGEVTTTCQGLDKWSYLENCTCGPVSSGFTPHIDFGRVIDGQKPSYSVGDFIKIECYAGYTLHGEAQIQYVGENHWVPGVPTCQLKVVFITLKAFLKILLKVIVAVVVFLAAFWAYKKFFSQNGKRDSTPCTAEYKICKA
ncbi:C4b-binding protein alpha chain, partial [Chaetura pelagica]